MNPQATQERSKVVIRCEDTILYSFVSHLSAALRREGISPLVNASIPYAIYIDISESEAVDANKSRSFKFIRVSPTHFDDFERILSNWISTDSELVEEVVNHVYGYLYPAERVGIYSKLLEIEKLLYMQPDNVRSIGIWGMPGIGKTTLARAVFNHMSTDYDAFCFIENFDEAFHKQGLHHLLETTLGKILEETFDIKASYIMRPSFYKDKLCDKRILLVLDDVRDSLAADSFLGRLGWFGPGSLIIMTSTDKQVFPFCQINQIYEVRGLNKGEALQLFYQYAFGPHVPKQYDRELLRKVIEYANGNPLALSLYGQKLKRKQTEMESTFLDLEIFPQKMQDATKSVYNALDDNEKNIFLDIAFFLKGEYVNYVVELLEGCHHLPRVGIDVLVDKCAITLSENTVQIGNLFQDIFLMIFRREVESSTRMLEPSSIRYLLEDTELKASGESSARPNCGLIAEDIESIVLDTSNLKFAVKHDAFKNMFNLKFLKIYGSCSVPALNFPKGLHSLPRGLRFLHWENYPLQSLPQDFDLDNLFELCMFYSQLHTLGAGAKSLKMLKRIRLCHSQQLVEFDIPSKAQDIELIDLQGCTRLRNFPDTSQLHSLRVVNLSDCREIIEFQGAPPNIEELHLEGTSIREIPISIVSHSPPKVKLDRQKLLKLLENFQDVEHIDLESITEMAKVSSYNQGFGKLVHLNMKNCSHLRSLPDMVNLESLQVLHLSGCSELEEIKGFPRKMIKLYIGGTPVVNLPQLPKSLEFLNAHGCTYLKSVCLDSEQLPKHYTFSNCFNFSAQVIADFLKRGLSTVASLAQQQEVIKAPEVSSICIPAGQRQRSFFLLHEGSSVILNLASLMQKAISGYAMSVLVSFQNDYHNVVGLGIRCVSTWKKRNRDYLGHPIERVFKCWAPMEAPNVEWDHMFVFYDTYMLPGSMEVKFEFHTVSWENEFLDGNCKVTQCDITVVMASTNDTSHSGITRESESTSMIEEHSPSSSTVVETMKPKPILSSQTPEVSRKSGSTETMFRKWMKTIKRAQQKQKTLTDDEKVDPSLSRSRLLSRFGEEDRREREIIIWNEENELKIVVDKKNL